MSILQNFIPIFLFVLTFFGTGAYYSMQGVTDSFYQIPVTTAIIPSIAVAWCMNKSSTENRISRFIDGIRHPEIIMMCIVFLLAGAVSSVTKSIGSVESTVHFILSITPKNFLLVGVFIASALISTAIGTSIGTIATLGSLVVQLSNKGAFGIEIGTATLIGGAMFGDNISVISDTTIVSVLSQKANLQKKLKLNIKIATIAFLINLIMLVSSSDGNINISYYQYQSSLILPYLFLIILATMGINILIVLVASLTFSGAIGIAVSDYSILHLSQDISRGFYDMHEILVLSILTGGLSGLLNKDPKILAQEILKLLPKNAGKRTVEVVISFLVSLFDILLANNVVAIIFLGSVVKELAKRYNIKPHESAVWLDIFSCAFQGIIPHGAQILVASTISHVSPLDVMGKVYYCYILFFVALIYIFCKKRDCN